MTDDEMVKLAAKATGYVVFQERDMGGALIGYKVQLQDQTCYWWDPLNDDGDALRLAVKVGIHIKIMAAAVEAYSGSSNGVYAVEILPFFDPYHPIESDAARSRATRKAIVRRAAEHAKRNQFAATPLVG